MTDTARLLFDSTTAGDVPKEARLVGGYLDGRYVTAPELNRRRRPRPRVVTITVNGSTRGANVIDVEKGDATPARAARYCVAEHTAGNIPTVYTYLANLRTVIHELTALAVHPHEVSLWTAHYTNRQHLCGKLCLLRYGISPRWAARVMATQFVTAPASGGHYDISLVRPHWDGVDLKPIPTPTPLSRKSARLAAELTDRLHARQTPLPSAPPALVELQGQISRVLALKERP